MKGVKILDSLVINENLHGWGSAMNDDTKLYLEKVITYYENLKNIPHITIYPREKDIFRAFEMTPYDQVKVVILGQDPYHEEGQANGLAFSVNNGIKTPPSLQNIFRELQNDMGGRLRTNTDLSDWAEQGVLLLNSSLSVIEGKANSMSKAWEPFTDNIIEILNKKEDPIVFVLWGNNAKRKKKLIDGSHHCIIESAHPSPLSAYRGFFGSKPFSKINQNLNRFGYKEINWN